MMRILLFVIILAAFSCRTPGVVTHTSESRDTTTNRTITSDTTTELKVDTIRVAPADVTATVNLDSLCAELQKLRADTTRGGSVIEATPNTPGTVHIHIIESGAATIDCKTDSLNKVIERLTVTINTKDSIITQIKHTKETDTVKTQGKGWWFYFYRSIAFFFFALILLFVIARWAGIKSG